MTPNGPWRTDVHPSMPVTMDELLTDLRRCFEQGAEGVHLHVRDAEGAETLDPSVVNDCCQRVRSVAAEVGVSVEAGLTTGAWIVPNVDERIAMIVEWEEVDCATVNLSEAGFERVMEAMRATTIGIDVGPEDRSSPRSRRACHAPGETHLQPKARSTRSFRASTADSLSPRRRGRH